MLIACEFSGVVRRAFRALGHDAWSCDLLPAEDGSQYHIRADVRGILQGQPVPLPDGDGYWSRWDLMIAHPPCTRLANSGVRWLDKPPPGRTRDEMWAELHRAADFYRALRDAPIPRKAIENPVMHRHARALIGQMTRQVVQPWWFGDPFFKATGFELQTIRHSVPGTRTPTLPSRSASCGV